MDAGELLRTWPGWAQAGAETVFRSPAWRMPVRLGGEAAALRRMDAREGLSDTVDLDVTFDGTPCRLSLADSACYPDLHLLWKPRGALPSEVLLALVEKECGVVFSLLEGATRKMFGVKGLAEAPASGGTVFSVDGASAPLAFALDLPAELLPVFGRLEFIDTAHESIRSLTREIRADYETLMLTEDELAALSAGDFLLRPEGSGATARWVTEYPADAAVHVMSAASAAATFAQFADDGLPPLPPLADARLVRLGHVLADVEPVRLGLASALKIVSLP